MQPISWYIKRVRAMGPGELAWRCQAKARELQERLALCRGTSDRLHRRLKPRGGGSIEVMQVAPDHVAAAAFYATTENHRERLRERAEKLAAHRHSYLGLDAADLGSPIDWNRDHAHGVGSPEVFAPAIDYRDFSEVGDCKLVWEPNRHLHLVVLARWYAVSGDERFAKEVVSQIESWMTASPFLKGMNWRSPLELGIRLINWSWALSLVRESRCVSPGFEGRVLACIADHVGQIARHYSRGSSANNHLIGEAAGVWVATNVFRSLRKTEALRDEAGAILEQEIQAQTFEDGGSREQATGYLLFVAQFFLVAGVVGRRLGRDFSSDYWERLEAVFDFLHTFSEVDGRLPQIGDCDDGYVLDLGGEPGAVGDWLAAAAELLQRPDWLPATDEPAETPFWLGLGEGSSRNRPATPPALSPRSFPETGYYLLQSGRGRSREAIRVVFDCGDLGYGPLAAHGHADALSFVLYAFGEEIIADPGTYDYFTFPQWRNYFRGTAAHNTVQVDGQDQAEMLGPFLWGRRGETRCTHWEPRRSRQRVRGEHRDWRGVAHDRELELEPDGRCLTVRDRLQAQGRHTAQMHLHLGPACRSVETGESRVFVEVAEGQGRFTIEFDPRLKVTLLEGSQEPGPGWISRSYHRREPAPALAGFVAFNDEISFETRVTIGPVTPRRIHEPGRTGEERKILEGVEACRRQPTAQS